MTDNKCSPGSAHLLGNLPLRYIDGPDYCTVKDVNDADFALTVQPELMQMMERALLASAQSAQQWQPIETAPRDGSPILVCNSRHQSHAPVVVRWLDEMSNPDTGWCDAATASGDALYYNPNYFDWWMPHPAIPKASSVTSTESASG